MEHQVFVEFLRSFLYDEASGEPSVLLGAEGSVEFVRGVDGIVDGILLYCFSLVDGKVYVWLGMALFEEFCHGGEEGERVPEQYLLALPHAFKDDMPRVFACPVGLHNPRFGGAIVVLGKKLCKNVRDLFAEALVIADAGHEGVPIAGVWELEVKIGPRAKVFELLLAGFAGVIVGAVWRGHNFVEAIVSPVFLVEVDDGFKRFSGHEPVPLVGFFVDIFGDEAEFLLLELLVALMHDFLRALLPLALAKGSVDGLRKELGESFSHSLPKLSLGLSLEALVRTVFRAKVPLERW